MEEKKKEILEMIVKGANRNIREVPEVAEYDICNKTGTFGKAKLKAAEMDSVDNSDDISTSLG